MLKIRRPLGRLIFNMGIATPGKTVFLIETAPWCPEFLNIYTHPMNTKWYLVLFVPALMYIWSKHMNTITADGPSIRGSWASAAVLLAQFSQNFLTTAPYVLTHKQLEMHGCMLRTVATDTLVLKHHAIGAHNADLIFTLLDQFHTGMLHILWTSLEKKMTFKKNYQVI